MKITFTPYTPEGGITTSPPVPAKNVVPGWYKDMPRYVYDDKSPGLRPDNFDPNLTIKGCQPFLDALTAGYIYCSPADIEVRQGPDYSYSFTWRVDNQMITAHTPEQHPGMPPAVDGNGQRMKWMCEWGITVPTGYSVLYTHPFNRHDLPFRTLAGIVDNDRYPNAVQFPFEMIVPIEDRLIIERGTPLCQLVPFKRDMWESEVREYDAETTKRNRFTFASKIIASYKSQYWDRKSFT
jgi:hypothetical protein